MTLTFTQSSDQSFGGVPAYEAEFEVTGNFAIHIERTRGDAALILKQRTGGGKYALVDDFNYAKSKGEVLDYEASVTIPKFIKIVSEVEPTLAEIVTDGEVTEIKSQSKVVEITNNGTTEVIPDSGFAYLSKVNIKTNVPQSGEGGGSTGGSSIEYLDVSSTGWDALTMKEMVLISAIAKIQKNGVISVYSSAFLLNLISIKQMTVNDLTQTIAIGFAKEASIQFSSTGTLNPVSGLVAQEPLASLPRITEEEFYNLNA